MENKIEAKLNVVLHKNQEVIHNNPARFRVVKAGKRFGKSKWAAFEIAQWAGRFPGKTFWYIAPTFGQAESIAWQELITIIPNHFIKKKLETKLTIELTNNSKIILKGAENQVSLRGPNYDGIFIDEAAYIDEYAWNVILRGQLNEGCPACFISSPNEKGRNWYTNFCEDAKNRMDAGDKDYAYFYYTIYDNPTKSLKEIEDIRRGMPEYRWNLEYMAIESDFAGQLYGEFDNNRHVGEMVVENFKTVRGIDWGIGHPTVCLWARFDGSKPLSTSNPVYIYDEHVKAGEIINDSCSVILAKTGNVEIDWTVIDPSTKKRNSQTGRTDSDEFARCGVPSIAGDNRDRGIDIVKMFLKRNLVKINPKCINLLNELRNLQWGDKTGDDTTDTLRYMLVRIHDINYAEQVFNVQEQEIVQKSPNRMTLNINHFINKRLQEKECEDMEFIMQEVA